jgi:hypothetical protein
MYSTDNTNVDIPWEGDPRHKQEKLKEYKNWLDERNIKYSLIHSPLWDHFPASINMRNEDALLFKLTFGL